MYFFIQFYSGCITHESLQSLVYSWVFHSRTVGSPGMKDCCIKILWRRKSLKDCPTQLAGQHLQSSPDPLPPPSAGPPWPVQAAIKSPQRLYNLGQRTKRWPLPGSLTIALLNMSWIFCRQCPDPNTPVLQWVYTFLFQCDCGAVNNQNLICYRLKWFMLKPLWSLKDVPVEDWVQPPPSIRLSFNIHRRQPWIICTMVQFWCTNLPGAKAPLYKTFVIRSRMCPKCTYT